MRVKDSITNKISYKFKGLLVRHLKLKQGDPVNPSKTRPPWANWWKMATPIDREVGKDASLDGCACARRVERIKG